MNLDYAVLTAGKELADLSGRTLGQVLPDLIRTALSAGRRRRPRRRTARRTWCSNCPRAVGAMKRCS
jgi:hypothetical protein